MFAPDSMFETRQFLIIDDFQGMRSMLREMLKTFGTKHIHIAANGKEALAFLEQNNKYDAVLCDYNLGAGKNGQQILEEAKHRNLIGPSTAWIIITAEKTSDMVIGAAEYMPDDYIIKPINEASLRSRLEKVITKKTALFEIEGAIFAKNFTKAISLCDKALSSGKATTEVLRIKAGLLLDMGRYDAAKQLFVKILSVRDVPWAKTGLAKAAYHSDDLKTAQRLLKEVVNENPTYLEAQDWLVKTYEQKGELEEAQRVLLQSIAKSPNSMSRQKILGEIAFKRGDLNIAETAFRKTIKLGEHSILKTPGAHFSLAKICSEKNNPSEALQVLKNITKEFDDPGSSLHAKVAEGLIYQKSGDGANAIKASKEVAALLQENHNLVTKDVAVEAAQLLLQNGDKEIAENLLQTVVKNNHDNDGLIAQIKDMVTQTGGAMEDAQAFIDTARKEAIETNNRGVILAKEGKLDEAIQWLRDAKTALPNNKQILLNFANAAILTMQKSGRNDNMMSETRECLKKVGGLDPQEKRRIQLQELLGPLSDGA